MPAQASPTCIVVSAATGWLSLLSIDLWVQMAQTTADSKTFQTSMVSIYRTGGKAWTSGR